MNLRKLFDAYDTENNGIISFEEFKAALDKSNYPQEQVQEIFKSIVSLFDTLGLCLWMRVSRYQFHPSAVSKLTVFIPTKDVNNTGHICYTEFIAATLESHGHIEEERVAEAFDRIDSDDSGFISRENLIGICGGNCSMADVEEILKAGDKDGDGNSKFCKLLQLLTGTIVLSCSNQSFAPVSYPEFLEMFRSSQNSMLLQVRHMESEMSVDDSNKGLIGLDAKIPGGKYDSEAV